VAETDRHPLEATAPDGVTLRGWDQGEGPAIVLAHGITAHRDLVLHGSSHLPRAGYRLLAYDARGHGDSDPGESGSYGYGTLADDLEAFCEGGEAGRPVLLGHSMGAHTALAAALRNPDRYAALVLIGPVSLGAAPSATTLAHWDALADGLADGDVEGWLAAYEAGGLDPDWRETLLRIARDRMERHRHPAALAEALREVPRSVPYAGLEPLDRLELPTLVVASHDEADPGHPYATAGLIAERLPHSRLISEAPGESPLAWQGGKLSREIENFVATSAVRHRLDPEPPTHP
jgi:pimeloyl-ACP methyl ester carboxylesterase